MRASATLLIFLLAAVFFGQEVVYVCPMDPDVRSSKPASCSRCGMALRSGIPDPAEYPVDLRVTPRAPKAGKETQLEFAIRNPYNARPVKSFQPVHEKLFHLFVVSRDLQFFEHTHPALSTDGSFRVGVTFPTAGLYRMLGDFYPDGGMPQLVAKSVIVPGVAPPPATLTRDYATKDAANLRIEMTTEPAQPIAGQKTMLFFRVSPAEGLQQYLGAWGHMLAASDDLIDLIHTHPFIGEGGPQIQFNLTFPRARTFRLWVQFQRDGVVNTAHFDVPVRRLE